MGTIMETNMRSHVFISYVREDAELVDRLVESLKRCNIQPWIDRECIEPGRPWKQAIRAAIESGAHFIACFSRNYEIKDTTYMDEELALAAELYAARHFGQPWFIPVKLDDCDMGNRLVTQQLPLTDLEFVQLNDAWFDGVERIARVIQADTSEATFAESKASFNLVVADFIQLGSQRYDVSGRITDALHSVFADADLTDVSVQRVHRRFYPEDSVRTATEMAKVAHIHKARVVIWGHYDDAGFFPVYNLGGARPVSISPSDESVVGRWEIHTSDYQVARHLGLTSEPELGFQVLGSQQRLHEFPVTGDMTGYVRDILPNQMCVLALTTLSFLLEGNAALNATGAAVNMCEKLWSFGPLHDGEFWENIVCMAFEQRTRMLVESDAPQDDIINLVSRQLLLTPNAAKAHNNRGFAHELRDAAGDREKAFDDYQNAIRNDPGLALVFLNRGRLLYNNQHTDYALRDFCKYLTLEPHAPEREQLLEILDRHEYSCPDS